MKTLKILDWPQKRFYSETHPFHRWKKEFKENGIVVKFYHHHLDKDLRDTDFLLIHSRYFDKGKNIENGAREEQLITYLNEMRRSTAKLIWFDAADSTGSGDFSLISHVDVFLKKQLLKDKRYYTAVNNRNDLRIWLNNDDAEKAICPFNPCPVDQIHKLKLGWNLGLNDYRNFGYKLTRLSNFLPYSWYPVKFSDVNSARSLDLAFRGSVHEQDEVFYNAFQQRNFILRLLKGLKGNIASGSPVSKSNYRKELRNSRVSISPYGWGEICYRDFETFIAGSLLVKPCMQHLETYPDVYKENETYVPVTWSLEDLPERLDHILSNFFHYRQIAQRGQEVYKDVLNDSHSFIRIILRAVAEDLITEPIVPNKLNLSL